MFTVLEDKRGWIIRNAFVELAEMDDIEDVLKQNKWQYIKDGNKYYVVGEDSLRVAKMLNSMMRLVHLNKLD